MKSTRGGGVTILSAEDYFDFFIAEKVKRQKLREKFTRDTKEENFIVRILEAHLKISVNMC